jgi:hypothetical protein
VSIKAQPTCARRPSACERLPARARDDVMHVRGTAAGFAAGLLLAATQCTRTEPPRACTDDDALELFDERIAPLLAGDQLTSCNQCHLAGVELSLYAREDPCTTMACMASSGIVDLEDPEQSLVLDWILRAEPDSSLITERVIRAEHDAVAEWIEFNARCGEIVCAPVENPCGTPAPGACEVPDSSASGGRKPFADPGDCRDVTLEAGFAALVYSWRGRCYPCHFDSRPEDYEDAPRWIHDAGCSIGAVRTMHDVLELGLVDLDDPSASLLLLKPLAQAAGGVEHGGGEKMHDLGDPAYRDFLAWIERLAACKAG